MVFNQSKIRIKDIAEMAGVSVGTVDRVIHGRSCVSRVMQSGVVPTSGDCIASSHDFMEFVSELSERGREELADKLEVPEEMVDYIEVSANIIRNIIESSGAVNIWAPGVTLCDGIAYEYAEKCKLKMIAHDFEKDILASAINISKRYMGSKKRAETIPKR